MWEQTGYGDAINFRRWKHFERTALVDGTPGGKRLLWIIMPKTVSCLVERFFVSFL